MIATRKPGDIEIYRHGFYVFAESNVVTGKRIAQIFILNNSIVVLDSKQSGATCMLLRANI